MSLPKSVVVLVCCPMLAVLLVVVYSGDFLDSLLVILAQSSPESRNLQ